MLGQLPFAILYAMSLTPEPFPPAAPPVLPPVPARSGLTLCRVDDRHRYQALAILLTGQTEDRSPAVEQFLGYAANQQLPLDQIWIANRAGRTVAVTLVVPCSGRTGMVFLSPPMGEDSRLDQAALLIAACCAQDPHRIHLFQALLEPVQEETAQIFEAAGFLRLATLIYLQRALEPQPAALKLPDNLQVDHWRPELEESFIRAILASYQQTLDCPRLVGLRQPGDILAGHMAVGHFDPKLWHLVRCGNEPVGVMLLNPSASRQAVELVYLGLAPEWRGRGLARQLLQYGLALAARRGATSFLCAVDQVNTPARHLYRRLNFLPTSRRMALIAVQPS